MRYPRRIRVLAALVALFSLLFMQLAVAAYHCPDLMPAQAQQMADAGGDCGHEPDLDNPSLCQAHEGVSKSHPLELSAAPAVAPFVAAGWVLDIVATDTALPAPQADTASLVATAASPPIAIRHCCFRL